MKKNAKFLVTMILVPLMAAMGCTPAYAQTVEVEETPADIETMYDNSAPIADILAMGQPEKPTDLALLYHVPADASAEVMATRRGTLPLAITAGTGSDTRLSIDMTGAKAQVEEDGWGWKTWTVIGVCVAAIAVSAIFIVHETQDHGNSDDSGTHIDVSGSNNNVHIGPNNHPSTSTTHNNTTTSSTYGGEW